MTKRIFPRNATPDQKLSALLSQTKEVENCLEWIRCLNTDGYPRMGGNVKVHRLIYELANKEDITGYVVRHSCDNPRCINPLHLLKGTPTQNVQDRDERNRTFRKTPREVFVKIKSLLETGLLTQKEIANIVGVDQRRVSDVNCGNYSDEGKLIRR